jgi:hypothetical protein
MRGGVPLVADLDRVGAKPLHAFLLPAVGRIGQVAQEQAKSVLVRQQCRMARGSDGTQLHKELIYITHGPGPRILAREGAETLDDLLPTSDRRERKVPAQLLIAPTVQHRLEHLLGRVEQRHMGCAH